MFYPLVEPKPIYCLTHFSEHNRIRKANIQTLETKRVVKVNDRRLIEDVDKQWAPLDCRLTAINFLRSDRTIETQFCRCLPTYKSEINVRNTDKRVAHSRSHSRSLSQRSNHCLPSLRRLLRSFLSVNLPILRAIHWISQWISETVFPFNRCLKCYWTVICDYYYYTSTDFTKVIQTSKWLQRFVWIFWMNYTLINTQKTLLITMIWISWLGILTCFMNFRFFT